MPPSGERTFDRGRQVGYLKNDLIDEDYKGIDDWIAMHNRYAARAAFELL